MKNTQKYSFESFIIQCCRSSEWGLRKFLKRVLINAGFTITEDNYRSERSNRDKRYESVHNMLAVRGNPSVCLVAHTDVCRDHTSYMPQKVQPTIKNVMINGIEKSIIQDKHCEVQVGGDDRLGVAIGTWIALNTGYDLALLFTTDEEIGVCSSSEVSFPELLNFDLLLQIDRGNRSNQIVNSIYGTQLCSNGTAQRLIKISENINIPRYLVEGMLTDVLAIKKNGMCKDAINLTCGYFNSIGAQKDEFIDIDYSKNTMKYISEVIKYYDQNIHLSDEFSEIKEPNLISELKDEDYEELENEMAYWEKMIGNI